LREQNRGITTGAWFVASLLVGAECHYFGPEASGVDWT